VGAQTRERAKGRSGVGLMLGSAQEEPAYL